MYLSARGIRKNMTLLHRCELGNRYASLDGDLKFGGRTIEFLTVYLFVVYIWESIIRFRFGDVLVTEW